MELFLQTEYSAISSGTELALLTNDQDIGHWQGEPYPAHPGYAAVGRIIACGKEVAGLSAGDRIFAPCGHAAYHRVDMAGTLVVVVPQSFLGIKGDRAGNALSTGTNYIFFAVKD